MRCALGPTGLRPPIPLLLSLLEVVPFSATAVHSRSHRTNGRAFSSNEKRWTATSVWWRTLG